MGQIVSDVSDILDYNKNKKETHTARKQILAQMAEDEKKKTNLVKKVLATQRAKYGASGVAGRGTSTDAVLARLKSETEEPYNEKHKANIGKLQTTKVKKTNLVKTILSRFDNLLS